MAACFLPAHILLPAEGTALDSWASIAVDQFTSQPDYWEKAEAIAKGKPSTLHIVLPEAYLGTAQEADKLAAIRRTMADYLKHVLTRSVHGYIYLERTQQDGSIRQGLVGAVDLEQYSFSPAEKPSVRPSEKTVLERIPPRLAVRRGASVETPHVMMLADDAACTLIEPIGERKDTLSKLYEGELMLGGGHIAGWAVEEPALVDRINAAIASLSSPAAFDERWPEAAGQPPMVLAVGDGHHSLAPAKAYWEELKPALTPEQLETHPARFCLAEVCNIHSGAIQIEAIHRVLFGVEPAKLKTDLAAWLGKHGASLTPDGDQAVILSGQGTDETIRITHSPEPLTVGTVERFIEDYLKDHPAVTVDYIHGAAAAQALAGPGTENTALLLPDLAKGDIFKGVVMGGVLPRKAFSMGHAEEKRYYIECRSLTEE